VYGAWEKKADQVDIVFARARDAHADYMTFSRESSKLGSIVPAYFRAPQ